MKTYIIAVIASLTVIACLLIHEHREDVRAEKMSTAVMLGGD